MKTMMLFFLIYYPIMFALPDIRMKKVRLGEKAKCTIFNEHLTHLSFTTLQPPVQIIRNIPNNIAAQVAAATGKTIPVWAVSGVFVLIWGMGAKVIFSPASATAVASRGAIPAAELDKAYAMGFDDGSAGKVRGQG